MGLDIISAMMVMAALEAFLYIFALMNSWYHVIILMILLEFMSVKIFMICSVVLMSSISSLFLFFFSVMMVCEASMGMSLVVSATRGRGDEVIEV